MPCRVILGFIESLGSKVSKPCETLSRLKGNVASTFCICTTPCSPGCRPVPVNFKSTVAPPLARLPRISTGFLVVIATSNFQSRSGGAVTDKFRTSPKVAAAEVGRANRWE